MVWQAIQAVMPLQPQVLQMAAEQAKSSLLGTQGSDPMWLRCVTLTASVMPDAVGALYVNRYFHSEDKEKVGTLHMCLQGTQGAETG